MQKILDFTKISTESKVIKQGINELRKTDDDLSMRIAEFLDLDISNLTKNELVDIDWINNMTVKITAPDKDFNEIIQNFVNYVLWSEYSAIFIDGNYPVNEDEFAKLIKKQFIIK